MRQIVTLADPDDARKFTDYLLTLQIQSQLATDPDGIAVWICDEDKVPRAREELAAFTRNPADPRYGNATSAADALRRKEATAEKQYAKRQLSLEKDMAFAGTGGKRPVTIVFLVLSLAVALATNFGNTRDSTILAKMSIAPYAIHDNMVTWYGLSAIRSGEVWRLVTPIFLHFSVLHLAFNMLLFIAIGGSVETARGSGKLLLLVLVLAVTSNVAEYFVSLSLNQQPWLRLESKPNFGGMSGVLYGLFGYAWMKSKYEPDLGLNVTQENVLILMGWFVLCLFNVFGPIANVAHGVGLLGGLIIGYAPTFWRQVRGE